MPWPLGTNVENTLETTVRGALKARSDDPAWSAAIAPFMPPGTPQFQWVLEFEDEPQGPYARLTKRSDSRFGNGMPVHRKDPATGAGYLDESWRISIQLVMDVSPAAPAAISGPAIVPLDAVFSQIMREQFKFPDGRDQLEAAGIYNIKLTDGGESIDGSSFLFDCRTEVFFEPPAPVI